MSFSASGVLLSVPFRYFDGRTCVISAVFRDALTSIMIDFDYSFDYNYNVTVLHPAAY